MGGSVLGSDAARSVGRFPFPEPGSLDTWTGLGTHNRGLSKKLSETSSRL